MGWKVQAGALPIVERPRPEADNQGRIILKHFLSVQPERIRLDIWTECPILDRYCKRKILTEAHSTDGIS